MHVQSVTCTTQPLLPWLLCGNESHQQNEENEQESSDESELESSDES